MISRYHFRSLQEHNNRVIATNNPLSLWLVTGLEPGTFLFCLQVAIKLCALVINCAMFSHLIEGCLRRDLMDYGI